MSARSMATLGLLVAMLSACAPTSSGTQGENKVDPPKPSATMAPTPTTPPEQQLVTLADAWVSTVGGGGQGLQAATEPGTAAATWASVWDAFAQATLADGIEPPPDAEAAVDGTSLQLCAGEYGCSVLSAVRGAPGQTGQAALDGTQLAELVSGNAAPVELQGAVVSLIGALERPDGSLWVAFSLEVTDAPRTRITSVDYIGPDGAVRGPARGELRDPQLLRAGRIGTLDPPIGAVGIAVAVFPATALGGRPRSGGCSRHRRSRVAP